MYKLQTSQLPMDDCAAHLTLLLLHIMPPAALTQHCSDGPLLFMLHVITANAGVGGEDNDGGAAGCRFLPLPTVLGGGMFRRSTATPTPDPPRDSFIHVPHITE